MLENIYAGSNFDLSAIITAQQDYEYSYTWSGPGVIVTPNDQTTMVTAPSIDSDTIEMVTYFVTVSIPEGCEEIAEITFDILTPQIVLPNIFSPNGSQNRSFKVYSNLLPQDIVNYQMNIYNRWGQLIFESTDPQEAWDGTYNGELAPSDVYIYSVNFVVGDVTYEETGDVTLVR